MYSAPMTDITYGIIGTFMVFLFVIGICENALVVAAFCFNKRLRTRSNAFIVCLSVDNILMIVLTFPQVISSSFDDARWNTGRDGCVFNAFCATVTGLSQITLLTLVAVDRYLIIVKQKTVFSRNVVTSLASMAGCYLYAIGWALGPLLGWSRFELETGDISCSISWKLKSDTNLSYTMCLFTFVWFLPLVLIAFCYSNILFLVNRKKPGAGMLEARSSSRDKRSSKEWKVSVTVLLMIGAFVVSWVPYSIVSFWSVFSDVDTLPFGAILAPALIAKTSVIWNPVIYLCRHREYRRFCLEHVLFFYREKGQQSSSGGRQAHAQMKSDYDTVQLPAEVKLCKHEGGCSFKGTAEEEILLAEVLKKEATHGTAVSSPSEEIVNETPIE